MARFAVFDAAQTLPIADVRLDIQRMPDATITLIADDDRHVQLLIWTPFTVDERAEHHAINEDPNSFRHVLPLSGKRIVRGLATEEGQLLLDVEDDIRIHVPGAHHEAWRIEVDDSMWMPQPGGGLAAWLPGDDAAASPEEVVAAYLRYYRTKDDADFWAWEELDGSLVFGNGEPQWPRIVELVEHARNEMELHYIAAGPLEDLLSHHGLRFIDRIEAQARTDPKFKRAVAGVWLHPRQDPLWDRVQAILSGG
jgi:hypothetical protein